MDQVSPIWSVSKTMGLEGFFSVSRGEVWELGMLKLTEDGMKNYNDNVVFVDIGANIGTHSLYHLNNGRYVVAIDGMRDNILDILLGTCSTDAP